ncbi:MAG: hypothetical protein ACFCVK_21430 [Acidimicrobiales bacterium]
MSAPELPDDRTPLPVASTADPAVLGLGAEYEPAVEGVICYTLDGDGYILYADRPAPTGGRR